MKRFKVVIAFVIALGLFLGIAYFSFNRLMELLVHSKGEIMIPDLLGKTISEAIKITSEQEIYIKLIGEQHNEKIPPGSIISQQPPPGMVVRKGKVVKVIISSGGEMVYVPDVVGKSFRQTELILRQEGLLLGEETLVYSNKVKKDFVVAQDPEPGEIVRKGAMVNLVLSQGPASLVEVPLMPNLVGQSIHKVRNILEEVGLTLGEIKWVVNNTLAEGTVIKQSPLPGEVMAEETEVHLVLSQKSRKETVLKEERIYYELLQGGNKREVRIVIKDLQGEREVYRREHSPGSKISLPVQFLGRARVMIYVDEVLVEEKYYE